MCTIRLHRSHAQDSRVDLRQLRYFIAIIERGSFSKAAAALNVAQPALSLHVRNMEAELNAQLLFRSAKGVVATEAGETLLRHARLIIDQLATAETEIRRHDEAPAGEVRLGLPGTISEILSVPLIMAARARYPAIKLRIAEAMSGFVLQWLREGHVDLALLYGAAPDATLVSQHMLSETLYLLSPSHPPEGLRLPGGATLAYRQVAALPLILPSLTHGLRAQLEHEAAAIGVTLNTILEVDSYNNIKRLVENCVGCSILPYTAIAREVEEGRLRFRAIGKPVLKRTVHLARAATRPMTNAVAAIEALSRETLLALALDGRWSGAEPAA
nr:LysR substrate-binding domain-containing protein [Xanthobacter sp. NFM-26]